MMDELLKRDIILDHYQNPRNKREVNEGSYLKNHMAADSCIDDITVYVKIVDDKIEDIAFDGVGCTISTASTSIMTELLTEKTVDEALAIIGEYEKMIAEEDFDADKLAEANAFDTLGKQANRIKCGLIGIEGIKELLERYKDGKQ